MEDLAYVFTIGPDELEEQGIMLLESIKRNTSAGDEDIVIFVPEEEEEDLSKSTIQKIQNDAILLTGKIPIQDYPISAAQAALNKASEKLNHEYLVLLDTDTLVLDDIEIHKEEDADLFIKPEGIGNRYWSKSQSNEAWKEIFERYGFKFPENSNISTVDHREMYPPYYNSGVILTKNNDFPSRFVSLNKKMHGNLSESEYFLEMICLSLLSTEYNVYELSEDYNYSLNVRTPPTSESTKIVHYYNFTCLYRGLKSNFFREKIESLGIKEKFDDKNTLIWKIKSWKDTYDAFYFNRKDRIPYYRMLMIKGISILEITGTKNYARYMRDRIFQSSIFK